MTPSDSPGRLVGGRYRLSRPIGRGGMGTVWEGRDELLGRPVAVKEVRLPAELGETEQAELRERTLREARATARLSHPNVVTTYDVVEEDGRPWIVMELVAARSLGQVLSEDGPLPPHRVAEVGIQVLDALEVAHRQGVTHRDVKPGNVLITEEGRAVLTDFGIATMAGDPSLTSTGVVLGSPAYMSPERARGQRPGPAGDLWSLGATLYAALEGRPPYDRENALGTLTAVISEPVEPPSVDGPLATAILGLLEKDPADRTGIEQARELLRAAARERADAPAVTAADPGALDRAGRTAALALDAGPEGGSRPVWREAGDERDHDGAGRRIAPAAVAVGLLVLLLAAGLAAIALRDDGATPNRQAEPGASTSAPATRTSSPSATTTTAPSSPAPSTTAASTPSGAAVPAGFRRHDDPTGFTVAVPAGWRAVRTGQRVDFREPGGSRFLRVDQTDEPKEDPVADWQQQERSVSQRLRGYQRIRIQRVDYRDYAAADWEFTFGTGPTHVLNRGMNTGEKGYALYWSTPASQWERSRPMWDVFTRTFQPAG